MKNYLFLFSLVLSSVSCTTNTTPKPNAFLNLEYLNIGYTKYTTTAYTFETSKKASITIRKNLWADICYPELNAEVNITYHAVNNNITALLRDAEKLTYKHTVKADNIEAYPFEDSNKKVYAKLYEITGDAASTIQFNATDSTKHFLSGALYFNSRPNFDSIQPAVEFVKKDIKKIIESLEWKY
ncbi:gliding motility lipoprotein GldD [Flavobacteriaceae bacterium]|nr:gliding motility lipoprotein GldD [Flavobacteriaceae bacterium]